MRRDDRVVLLGEDIAGAGGVFKTTAGLLEEFGPKRVIDTPISEQAILGAAMGAAMTGLRPDRRDHVLRLLRGLLGPRGQRDGQDPLHDQRAGHLPLVIRTGNGGGLRFGAQHSQCDRELGDGDPGRQGGDAVDARRTWSGLMAAAVRSDDPVLFFEHKGLYASKAEVPDGEIVDALGTAAGPPARARRDHRRARPDGAPGVGRG